VRRRRDEVARCFLGSGRRILVVGIIIVAAVEWWERMCVE
jgi:hypothetical protein